MRRPRFSATLPAVLLLATPSVGQIDVAWFQQLDTADHIYDRASRVEIAPNGTVISVVSHSISPSSSGMLLAHTAAGAHAWTASWTANGDPVHIADIAIDPANGDVYAVGWSRAYVNQTHVPGSANIAVARFNGNGTLVWQGSWDGPSQNDDGGHCIELDGAGRVLVSGTTSTLVPGTSGYGELAVLAFDTGGAFLWSTIVPATASGAGSLGEALRIGPDGDIFTAGTGAGTYPDVNFAVTRIDSSGVELWTRAFDGPGHSFDRPYALAVDASSNVYVSGVVTGGGAGTSYEGALVKWNADGVLQWSRTGTSAHDSYALYDIAVDVRDDVLICGTARGGPATSLNALLFKVDASGLTIWERTWVGDGLRVDSFGALALDGFGGIVTAGFTTRYYSATVHESDPLVIRYDADGNERWIHRGVYSVPNSDGAGDVAFGPNGSVAYVGGMTTSIGGEGDTLIVRLVEQAIPFCFGDGSGTACPCGNASAVGDGAGCLNSLGAGAKLVDAGDASRFDDTLVLRTSGTPNAPVLFYQGTHKVNGGAGNVFGDGLSCAGGALIRLGTVPASSGTAAYPPPAGVAISVRGFVVQGTTYHYQARYRNSAAFCTSFAYNQTNGLSILWGL